MGYADNSTPRLDVTANIGRMLSEVGSFDVMNPPSGGSGSEHKTGRGWRWTPIIVE